MYWIKMPFRYLSLVVASLVAVLSVVLLLFFSMFFACWDELKTMWKFHNDQANWGWEDVKELWKDATR